MHILISVLDTINLKEKKVHSVKTPSSYQFSWWCLNVSIMKCSDLFRTSATGTVLCLHCCRERGRECQLWSPTVLHLIPAVQYLSTFNKTNIKNYLTCAWKHQAVNLQLGTCLWIRLSVLPHGYSVLGHKYACREGAFALWPAARRRSWSFRRKHTVSWVWWGKTSPKNKFLHAQNWSSIFCSVVTCNSPALPSFWFLVFSVIVAGDSLRKLENCSVVL